MGEEPGPEGEVLVLIAVLDGFDDDVDVQGEPAADPGGAGAEAADAEGDQEVGGDGVESEEGDGDDDEAEGRGVELFEHVGFSFTRSLVHSEDGCGGWSQWQEHERTAFGSTHTCGNDAAVGCREEKLVSIHEKRTNFAPTVPPASPSHRLRGWPSFWPHTPYPGIRGYPAACVDSPCPAFARDEILFAQLAGLASSRTKLTRIVLVPRQARLEIQDRLKLPD